MKTTKLLKSLALALAFAGSIPCSAEPARNTLSLPENIEQEISNILKIKTSSMSLRAMRSENGVLGKEAEASMDQLGSTLTDEALIQQIRAHETGDIRAKIALWAVDRKVRPEEYKRFARYYVNAPTTEESVEYYSRVRSKPPVFPGSEDIPNITLAGGNEPDPLDKKDQIEKNRLIMEYCFFMPPIGNAFTQERYRINFMNALLSLDKPMMSLIVFIQDGKCFLNSDETIRPNGGNNFPNNFFSNKSSVFALSKIITKESFQTLASFWQVNTMKETIKFYMSQLWAGIGSGGYEGDFVQIKAEYDAWMELSRLEWSEPAEKEFAKWLQTVPGPSAPAPQYTDDPNNPFLPLRPIQK